MQIWHVLHNNDILIMQTMFVPRQRSDKFSGVHKIQETFVP